MFYQKNSKKIRYISNQNIDMSYQSAPPPKLNSKNTFLRSLHQQL